MTFNGLHEALLKMAKNAKAPGEGGISRELYKYTSREFKSILLDFLNMIHGEKKVPEESKTAGIIPLFKKGVHGKLEKLTWN